MGLYGFTHIHIISVNVPESRAVKSEFRSPLDRYLYTLFVFMAAMTAQRDTIQKVMDAVSNKPDDIVQPSINRVKLGLSTNEIWAMVNGDTPHQEQEIMLDNLDVLQQAVIRFFESHSMHEPNINRPVSQRYLLNSLGRLEHTKRMIFEEHHRYALEPTEQYKWAYKEILEKLNDVSPGRIHSSKDGKIFLLMEKSITNGQRTELNGHLDELKKLRTSVYALLGQRPIIIFSPESSPLVKSIQLLTGTEDIRKGLLEAYPNILELFPQLEPLFSEIDTKS